MSRRPGASPEALEVQVVRQFEWQRTDILSDDDGPILSVVNIVDGIDRDHRGAAGRDRREPAEPLRDELKEYRSSGQIGEGEGAKAGTAYRLKSGTMVYVPEPPAGE